MARSIVEYFPEDPKKAKGSKCGYCKQEDTRYSNGMWGHVLTARDYQDLIDRGWRRSGQYCYKPNNVLSCCPMYTIRCQALNFKPTKSQKKVLRRFKNYIENGIGGRRNKSTQEADDESNNSDEDTSGSGGGVGGETALMETERVDAAEKKVTGHNLRSKEDLSTGSTSPSTTTPLPTPCSAAKKDIQHHGNMDLDMETGSSSKSSEAENLSNGREHRQGKAKQMRRERWRQKQLAKGLSGELEKNGGKMSEGKSLEDWLKYKPDSLHKFQIRIVSADLENQTFLDTFEESLSVYQKYQVAVHGDSLTKCNAAQYKRFLCKNPLSQDGIYGAFHRHYLLNGKIIAVGVIDILPNCVSSVYLYYDPDYAFLSLGTYTSLNEMGFVRSLHRRFSALQYYYLGFYIHSCPKMRYKGEFSPSELCCPESYTWQPIQQCRPLLDAAPYARFCPNLETVDENAFKLIKDVMVLHHCKMMSWSEYAMISGQEDQTQPSDTEKEEVTQYGELVGRIVAARMLLYRP
eukprot:TRINITY_DN7325_c0_g1_i1.p1 TRINITY_DN7325_c0_g1~~TRINITY_DN7325_c0_g1_i1.p1  ORF type:complete len:530 (-),score=93.96 TRINITY_DN7325_c0_g1_i1:942-2495(-)